MTSGGRSRYDKVRLVDLEPGQKILITDDADKIPDSPRNCGLNPWSKEGDFYVAGHRTGTLTATIVHIQVETADRLSIFTDQGNIRLASVLCPAWKIRQ